MSRPVIMYVVAAVIAPKEMSRHEQARIRDALDKSGVGEVVRIAVAEKLAAVPGTSDCVVEVSR